MNPRPLTAIAASIVRGWTWLYTRRMPDDARDCRRSEIESDLWELRNDRASGSDAAVAVEILLRLAIGVTDDLQWRFEQGDVHNPLRTRATIAAATAVLVVATMWLTTAAQPSDTAPSAPNPRAFIHRTPSPPLLAPPPLSPASAFDRRQQVTFAIVTSPFPRGVDGHRLLQEGTMTSTTKRTVVSSLVAASMAFGPATAQPPTFEVASVKPNRSGGGLTGIRFPGVGQFQLTNMTLRDIVRLAFQVMPQQVEGGPEWADSERYDVVARAEGRPTMSQVFAMLQALLRERFALQTHTETREMPIYTLVFARADRRLGARIQPAGDECRPAKIPTGLRGAPPPPPPPGPSAAAVPPDDAGGRGCPRIFGPGFLTVRQTPMATFARDLSPLVRRMVFDRTGLEGRFDIDVEFAEELRPAGSNDAPAPFPPDAGPSIFTALQEQLGLKLEAMRGPVDVLVIDRAERPTEN